MAPAEPIFFLVPLLLRAGVQAGQGPHDSDHLRVARGRVVEAAGLEEAAAQHLGHVFLADGQYAFLLLPPDDVEELGLQRLAQGVVLVRIGGE